MKQLLDLNVKYGIPRGRVRPSHSIDLSAGVEIWREEGRSAALQAEFEGLAGPPELSIQLRQRRSPVAAASRQLLAIVVEAARNAYRHSGADLIEITGLVDRHSAEITVADNGTGFEPSVLPDGHYGIMGMKERADRIGATVRIDSSQAGTKVHVAWRDSP
jgi:signal transduction histidine kinase